MTVGCRLLAAVLVLLLTAAPAHAAGELGLSRDGVTWTPQLTDPLFDSSVRWVPGDVRSESFFVRNQSSAGGRLSIDILGTSIHTLLDTGDVDIDAQGAGGAWVVVSSPGTHRLLSEGSVPAGGVREVAVTVHFDPASTNVSQLKSLELAFRVNLVQDVDADGSDGSDGSDGDDDGSGILPDTGAPPAWWAIVGLATLGLGVVGTRRVRPGEVRS
jgi:LPXTG-motif cell wall-anchored protein